MQTKEDLRALFQDRLARLFAETLPLGAAKRYRFMHTSGTTGLPLPVPYIDRPDWIPKYLGTGPRVLMISGSKALRVDFARSYADEDTAPSDFICLNVKTPPEVLERVRTDFRPTSFVGTPSVWLRVTQAWPAASCEAIISITLASELATKEMTEEIARRFPNAVIHNYYPSIDAGLMGEQCEQCAWNEFHPVPGVSFDIREPGEDGVGVLLVTKANKGGLPLEQYRIGDLARADAHQNGQRTIRLYGRQGFDYIKLADALLVREEFDRVARELERYIDDYKAEVRTEIHDGAPLHHLSIFARPLEGNGRDEAELAAFLAAEFAARLFVTPNATLQHAIASEVFAPLTIHIVPEIVHTGTKPQRLRFIEA